jgi:predicted RNA-binding Zn-ribbon protein involved in translation (DUF1610 family)
MSIEEGRKLIQLGIESGDPELVKMGKGIINATKTQKQLYEESQEIEEEIEENINTHTCLSCDSESKHHNPRKKKCPSCGKLKLKLLNKIIKPKDKKKSTILLNEFQTVSKFTNGNIKSGKVEGFINTWSDTNTEALEDKDLTQKLGRDRTHTSSRQKVGTKTFTCINCQKVITIKATVITGSRCDKCSMIRG